MNEEKPHEKPTNPRHLDAQEARELLDAFFEEKSGTVTESEREAAISWEMTNWLMESDDPESWEAAALHFKNSAGTITAEEVQRATDIHKKNLARAEKEIDARIAAHGDPWSAIDQELRSHPSEEEK